MFTCVCGWVGRGGDGYICVCVGGYVYVCVDVGVNSYECRVTLREETIYTRLCIQVCTYT